MRPLLPLASAVACALLTAALAWSLTGGGFVAYVGADTYAVSGGGVTIWTSGQPISRHRMTWLDGGDQPVNADSIAAAMGSPFDLRAAGFAYGRFDTTDPRDRWLRASVPPGRPRPPLIFDTVVIVPLWPFVLLTAWSPLRVWRQHRWPPPGACPNCGYDVRATPERCPECGRIPGR